MYWAIVVLSTLVFFLAAAVVVYVIRDARHQGREEILGEVRNRCEEDRALVLQLYQVRQEMDQQKAEAALAFAQREAAQLAQAVPIAPPLDYRRSTEQRKQLKSFSFDAKDLPGPNPFLTGTSSESSASSADLPTSSRQQQPLEVVADVHASPKQQQPQQKEVVAQAAPPQRPKVVAAPKQQQQPQLEEVVTQAEPPQQPKVVVAPKQQQQPQLEEVVTQAEPPQRPKVVAAPKQQRQQVEEAEDMPKFSLAFHGIRAKLEKIFEPRPVHTKPKKQQQLDRAVATDEQQQQGQQEVVAVVAEEPMQPLREVVVAEKPKQQQPKQAAVVEPEQPFQQQQHADKYGTPQGPKLELVAAAPSQTATIRRPSIKTRRAPPPPTLPKPKMPVSSSTLPRPRKEQPDQPEVNTAGAAQAASNANQAAQESLYEKKKPPLPIRQSSLRRTRSVPLRVGSKQDLPTSYLVAYNLFDDEMEQFETYV